MRAAKMNPNRSEQRAIRKEKKAIPENPTISWPKPQIIR